MYNTEKEPGFWDKNRILIKGMLVGLLIIIMLVPAHLVESLVYERQTRQRDVISEVSDKWANEQTITGPVLMLPYKAMVKNTNGTLVETTLTAYILPEELNITGNMLPTVKKRSLYSVMLYSSKIKLEGKFNTLPLEKLKLPPESILWNEAKVVMSMNDMRGLTDQVTLNWNGTSLYMEAGVPDNEIMKEGLSAQVPVNAQSATTFSIDLGFKGSGYLYFIPLGKTTDVKLSAPWKDPAFDGKYLPDTSNITAKDFTAHWHILPMSHNYPQYWKNSSQDLSKGAFGVRLIQPVDGYFKTTRAVKYALLFIALTFTFFFFLEILLKRQIHAVQYLLVGVALTIFYTLLLSISEYSGFNTAYLIASVATVTLISLYVWSMFRNGKTAAGFTATLAMLYGYIFILIQLEDYALLFGSIGLFAILAVIMYYSRKIDWYAPSKHKQVPDDKQYFVSEEPKHEE